jgi:hypothetical protein
MESFESQLLDRIERAATAGPGAENVECLITHHTVYVRRGSDHTTLFAIACNFQPRHCSIRLCGEVFERAAPPIPGERGPSYRVETVAIDHELPTPQLLFGVLRYDEDAHIQGMLDMIASAVALAVTPLDGTPSLLIGAAEIAAALASAQRALDGESNDAEHDALYELAETLDGWLSLAVDGTRTATAVSDSLTIAATRVGELLLEAAERHGLDPITRQAFIGALAASDLDTLVRRLIEHT